MMLCGVGPSCGELSPLRLSPSLWLRPDDGVYTGGSRTTIATDKTCFQIADNASVSTGDIDFTWAGWVNVSTVASSPRYAAIVSKYNPGSNSGEFQIYRDTATLKFEVLSGSTSRGTITSGAIAASTWYFFVCTHDAVANTISMWINNTAVTPVSTTGPLADSVESLSIGGYGIFPAINNLGGSLASIGFWKRTLTAAERTYLYNFGNNLVYADLGIAGTDGANLYTNLVSYWNCNETDPTAGLVDQHGTNDCARVSTELVTNGTFTANINDWTNDATYTWDTAEWVDDGGGSGHLHIAKDTTPAYAAISSADVLATNGRSYTWACSATKNSGGALFFKYGDPAGPNAGLAYSMGSSSSYSGTFTATASNKKICIEIQNASTAADWNLDNVSIKSAAIAIGNGPAEAVASDSVGTAHGTLTGFTAAQLVTAWTTDVPTQLAGDREYSLTFDGSANYVKCGTTFNMTGSKSVSFWVKSSSATLQIWVALANGTSDGLFIGCTATGYIIANQAGNTTGAKKSSVTTLLNGAWHHVVITKTTNSVNAIYVDGVDVSAAPGGLDYFSIAAAFAIGANHTPACFANGKIKDVRIYNAALSAAQIAAIYAHTTDYLTNLVARYDFNDGPFGNPTDGDPIWGWESQEGSRYQLVNGTPANRVVHRLTGINGYPAEEGDGANDIMRVPSITGMSVATPTFAVVCKPYDVILDTPAAQALLAVQDEGSANNFVWLGISSDGKATIQGNNAGTAFTVTGATVLSDNTVYILLATWDGSNWQLSINGVAETETRTGTEIIPASLTGLDSTTVFARYSNATASNWFKGLIAEPFADTLPAERVGQLVRHWKRRYGIA
jgi:hypothetical protein